MRTDNTRHRSVAVWQHLADRKSFLCQPFLVNCAAGWVSRPMGPPFAPETTIHFGTLADWSAMLHVVELNTLESLYERQFHWSALLAETRGATYFQSLEWLADYWRFFGQEQRLRVLFCYQGRRPIGILPLVVVPEPTRVGTVRVLTYPLHDWGTFYGPVGPMPAATLYAGLAHVRRTERNWDVLELRWVDRDGADRGDTEAALREAGFAPQRHRWSRAALVEFRGSWGDYWCTRPAKLRENLRAAARRLERWGPVEHVRWRPAGAAWGDGDPRWDLYEACVALAQRSWQGHSTTGTTLSHDAVRDYLRAAHASAARAGAADINLLLVAGEPAAFAYNYCRGGWLFGLRTGYDPRFSQGSPGRVLQHRMLQDSFHRGDGCFDLGTGYFAAKRPWHTRVVTSYRYAAYPRLLSRTQLLRWSRWLDARLQGDRYLAGSPGGEKMGAASD